MVKINSSSKRETRNEVGGAMEREINGGIPRRCIWNQRYSSTHVSLEFSNLNAERLFDMRLRNL
jgi:hypothetical protein